MRELPLQQTGESHSPGLDLAYPPAQPLSTMPLAEWRGSLTAFKGFTGTKPALELKSAGWDGISNLLRPNKPAIIADKKEGQYVVPCLLKVGPLVGLTLEAATKNGQPTIGRMRSKQHVTEAAILFIDIDGLEENAFKAGLAKIKGDGLTYLAYTTHSHGREDKPGMRVRFALPIDHLVNIEDYSAAWHGLDQHYWNGLAGQADSSGANLYQQQGTWCCDPSRIDQAEQWTVAGGVASADALIAIGRVSQAAREIPTHLSPYKATGGISNLASDEYPPSDANKVADACQQIGEFRDTQGADQSEPFWFDCLGVVGHCENGAETCQEWSSGHSGYDERKTSHKLAYRLKTSPTTCAQFNKTNPDGCAGCIQKCRSPITLGWEDAFVAIASSGVKA